jgi:hypothetical protein
LPGDFDLRFARGEGLNTAGVDVQALDVAQELEAL